MGMGLSLRSAIACVAAVGYLLGQPAAAQDIKPDSKGPGKVTLGKDLATLNLPKGYMFFGADKAKQMMDRGGNSSGNEVGAILPTDQKADFGIILEFDDTGYVEDKDAGKIDADKILDSYKEGTEQSNEQRKERGLGPLHVTGWEEKPSYDAQRHVVIWSLQGENDKKEQFVNYNTRVLGRNGVLSVNLMCDNKDLPAVKPRSQEIVKNISFNPSQRYEDFKTGDKISEGGLVALIAGGGLLLAKKTGVMAFLFMMLKPFLLLLKAGGVKLIGGIVLGLGWVGSKLFGKKDSA